MNNIKNANLYPRNTVAKAYINIPIKSFLFIIIIVFLKRDGEYVISISRYMKFGITKEVYFNVMKKMSSLNNIEGSNFISASIKSLNKLKK